MEAISARAPSLEAELIERSRHGDHAAFRALSEPLLPELRLHCYRMLGSLHDAEDALQDALLRAWSKLDTFAGRSTFRTWLFQVVTNTCLNAIDARRRRQAHETAVEEDRLERLDGGEVPWLGPYPDRLLPAASDDPAASALEREGVELAFIAAVQHLLPRQRVVLILRDVLEWSAAEVAELLGSSVASVNSLLQRARAALRGGLPAEAVERGRVASLPTAERELVRRYLQAWEGSDVAGLVALLQEDAVFTMPPDPLVLRGPASIAEFLGSLVPRCGARRVRLVETRSNGQPALGVYFEQPGRDAATFDGVVVLAIREGKIGRLTGFRDPSLAPYFGLPATLPA